MDFSWAIKYATEFLGTAILIILGNGAVANVELKGTKGHQSGWLVIAVGYGMGVMIPALMFGNTSGNHINPAFTLALAISGYFPWAHVAPYILAQVLGAIFGQALVVATHRPYYLKTENPNNIEKNVQQQALQAAQAGQKVAESDVQSLIHNTFAQATNGSSAVAHLALGFLVMALVTSLGGPTGPGLNPARDLGPRILHFILPKSILGEHKGDSKWWYSWVPVVAPIAAGIAAVALFKAIYG